MTDQALSRRAIQTGLAPWPQMVPFAGRIAALQAMHPIVAQGLHDHSNIFQDPYGRARESARYAFAMAFGDDIETTAAEIREMHRNVKGVTAEGRRYHAWNSKAWAWVHLTTIESVFYGAQAVSRALSPGTQQDMYAEWRAVGRLYGVGERYMPADISGFREYIDDTVEHELEATPTMLRAVAMISSAGFPPPARVPATAWSLGLWPLRPPIGYGASVVVFGAIPPVLRERLGIRWTRLHEAQYGAVLAGLRVAMATLPDRLRLLPAAYGVNHDRRAASGA